MIEICKTNLRELDWGRPDYWAQLIPTASYMGRPRICKDDVLRLFDYIIHEVARNVNLPFDEVNKVMREENSAFLSYVDAIFSEEEVYKENSEKIRNLSRLLIAPRVPLTVSRVVNIYYRLTSDERKKFIEYITKSEDRF
jgi:hypothetical protein